MTLRIPAVDYEGVCACGHAQGEHAMGGPCDRCQEPPCAFFVLWFHREIVILPPRWTGPDPVGFYWRFVDPPRGTPARVFSLLSEADRSEVASKCFQEAKFDRWGELDCRCGRTNNGLDYCLEEYLCEVFGAFIVVPRGADLVGAVEVVAALFEIEPWVLRFRRVLEGNLTPAIAAHLDFADTYQAPVRSVNG